MFHSLVFNALNLDLAKREKTIVVNMKQVMVMVMVIAIANNHEVIKYCGDRHQKRVEGNNCFAIQDQGFNTVVITN